MSRKISDSDEISLRGTIGALWGAWINVGIFALTVAILENNRRNVRNTAKMAAELESINAKLK